MKVLAEIAAPSPSGVRAGALRRRDHDAFDGLLSGLDGAGSVLVTGTAGAMQAGAIALAGTAAAAGTRTALLECELADPRLAGELGLAAAPGLHEYLRQEVDPSRILQPLALAGPGTERATEPLVCVVAGRPSADGPALLASAGLRQALGRLRSVYELVVVCGPSLRGEAGQLQGVAAQADAALACVGRSEARGRSARRLKRHLRELPTEVAGVIAYRS